MRAAMVNSLAIRVNILPLAASTTAFFLLMVDHLL
jgi:hypothetical protein